VTTSEPATTGANVPNSPLPLAMQPDHHADVSGGWLRAATFGAMDGLVTNIALIAGVGGGGVSAHTLILTGIAGLVAGAASMGLGEYTSVKAQNDQILAEVERERRELKRFPDAEANELATMWISRGLPEDIATQMAHVLKDHPEEALRIHVREELGVDPEDHPSPWTAAISSFLCFCAGAIIPLLPYLVGLENLWIALGVGGVGLITVGALIAKFTGKSWWVSGLRQLALGGAAALITYGVGHLIGGGVV